MSEENQARWYVIHTYSGHENKVKATIEKTVENRNMGHLIQDVAVPVETVVEIKNGVKKEKKRKIFPGYTLVKMIITDESWYIVRNTKGVTGFVGPASKPVPLTEKEVKAMGVEKVTSEVDFEVGDVLNVIEGPFDGFSGEVQEINLEKGIVKVLISMFGRETPVELEFTQVKK